jgi:hypothetical protein
VTPEKAHRKIGDDNDDDLFRPGHLAELSRNQMQGGVIGKITHQTFAYGLYIKQLGLLRDRL